MACAPAGAAEAAEPLALVAPCVAVVPAAVPPSVTSTWTLLGTDGATEATGAGSGSFAAVYGKTAAATDFVTPKSGTCILTV